MFFTFEKKISAAVSRLNTEFDHGICFGLKDKEGIIRTSITKGDIPALRKPKPSTHLERQPYTGSTEMMQVEFRTTEQTFGNGLLTVLISITATTSTIYLETFGKFGIAVKAIDAL